MADGGQRDGLPIAVVARGNRFHHLLSHRLTHTSPPPSEVQYLDANCSLDRLTRASTNDPWCNHFPTIIGSAKLVMRRRSKTGVPQVRPLLGRELMAVVGWGRDDYSRGTSVAHDPHEEHNLLTSLAGNAFSAFAIGPALAATLCMLHVEVDPARAVGGLWRCQAPPPDVRESDERSDVDP